MTFLIAFARCFLRSLMSALLNVGFLGLDFFLVGFRFFLLL